MNNSYNEPNMPDMIYYINLDRRPDRKQNIQNLLKYFDLEKITERISGVDGSKLDLDNIPKDIITPAGIADAKDKNKMVYVLLTPGGIGCAMSHRNAYKKIIDNNLSSALILEDDIRIDRDFHKKLHYLMNKAEEFNYDVMFLGYHPSSIKYIKEQVNDVFVRSSRVYGLFGYVVSNAGAKKLLDLYPIDKQIDTEISDNSSNLNMLLVIPEYRIITSDPSEVAHEFGTDIQFRRSIGSIFEHEIFYVIFWILFFIIGMHILMPKN
jgi:glycosyl transferase family 25